MFTLKIDTGNAAFGEAGAGEVARLLREAARKIEHGHRDGSLLDINGNAVGKFRLTGVKS